MNKLALSTALAAVALAIPAAAPAQKVGSAVIVVVDSDRVFRECTACKAAQTQLQTQLQQLQQRAQQLGQPLETEAASIRTAAGGKAPDAALQKRIQDLQTRQSTAAQEIQRSEATFTRTRAYVAQQTQTRLGPIIQQVMTTRGANIALDTQATLARSPAIDVTNDVLTALNQQLPSVVTTAPAAPQQQQQPQGR